MSSRVYLRTLAGLHPFHGSWLLGGTFTMIGELAMDLFAAKILISLVLGYWSLAISDYMIHRYIWHGRWPLVHMTLFKKWLYPHFVHHWEAHHSHARRGAKDLFQHGEVSRDLKKEVEDRYRDDPWLLQSLQCSNHGLSIKDVACALNYCSIFLLTPHPFVCLLIGYFLGPGPAAVALSTISIAVFTQINHRFYHMKMDARVALAPRGLRWFFLSKEFDVMAREHLKHHYSPAHSDDFYSVMPFGRFLIRPIFRRN